MIRDNVKKEKIQVEYLPTQEMVADIMTKPQGYDLHHRASLKMMGYVDIISKPGQKLSGELIRDETSDERIAKAVQSKNLLSSVPNATIAQTKD